MRINGLEKESGKDGEKMKQLEIVTTVQITQIIDVPDDYDDSNAVQDAAERSDSVLEDIRPAIMDALTDDHSPDNISLGRSQVFIHENDE